MTVTHLLDRLDEGWALDSRSFHQRLLHCYGHLPSHRPTAEQIAAIVVESQTEFLTVYTHGDLSELRSIDDFPLGYGGVRFGDLKPLLPIENFQILVNLNHARSAKESQQRAEIARDLTGCNWLKLEVLDASLLRPENDEVIAATESLRNDGYEVLPLIQGNAEDAKALEDLGCLAVRVTMADIGSHQGMRDPDLYRRLRSEISIPIIAEGGLGSPADAFHAMASGADAVLTNTALFTSQDPVAFIRATRRCVDAGRVCYVLDRAGAGVERWTQSAAGAAAE